VVPEVQKGSEIGFDLLKPGTKVRRIRYIRSYPLPDSLRTVSMMTESVGDSADGIM
jgi:hypothetical protein